MMASANAKSSEMKSGIPFNSLFSSTTPSSPQGNSDNLPSPPSVGFPAAEKSSICRMQGAISFIILLLLKRSVSNTLFKNTSRTLTTASIEFTTKIGNRKMNFHTNLIFLDGIRDAFHIFFLNFCC